jgi:hypothetical protein
MGEANIRGFQEGEIIIAPKLFQTVQSVGTP